MAGTRQKLIDAALILFCESGFHSVGLDRILATVGVTKTTFYNHFETKEDLIRTVVASCGDDLSRRLVEGVQRLGGDSAKGRIMALFDLLDELAAAPAFSSGLLVGAAVEFPDPEDLTHQTAVENREIFRRIVRSQVENLGATDSDSLVDDLCLLFEAALLQRHAHQDRFEARRARNLAALRLEAELST